jgi:hypothetical protein
MSANVAARDAARHPISGDFAVIASEAKQSITPQVEIWIASSLRSSQ